MKRLWSVGVEVLLPVGPDPGGICHLDLSMHHLNSIRNAWSYPPVFVQKGCDDIGSKTPGYKIRWEERWKIQDRQQLTESEDLDLGDTTSPRALCSDPSFKCFTGADNGPQLDIIAHDRVNSFLLLLADKAWCFQ